MSDASKTQKHITTIAEPYVPLKTRVMDKIYEQKPECTADQ